MPFFKSTLDLIKGVFRPTQRSHTEQENRTYSTPSARSGLSFARENSKTENGAQSTNRSGKPNVSKKRKALDSVDGNVRKRVKNTSKSSNPSHQDAKYLTRNSGAVVDVEELLVTKKREDQRLMPPPTKTLNQEPPTRDHKHSRHRQSMESLDSSSDIRSSKARRAGADDEYDMEAARRLAAATELPPNSGVWDAAEKELFFHLSYRGFEPLLSRAWMRDFPTLPLSLFAVTEDQKPLIEIHQSSEFRAIRILRELIETGKSVRDRALISGIGDETRTEPIIERAVKKYIKWTMKDMAISTKRCIPVHAVVSMKPGQSTQDTIRDLTIKMHNLSSRHREAYDILTSIEQEEEETQPPTPPRSNGDARVENASHDSEQDLPIIYGLMICSSLLAVFTLNSHTTPPSFMTRAQNESRKTKSGHTLRNEASLSSQDKQEGGRNNHNAENEENEDSGLRFISSFDFSNSAADVWNAFVIAITAMMVRKTLVDIYEIPSIGSGSENPELEESVLDSSLLEADDTGAGSRYVARYGGSYRRNEEGQAIDGGDNDEDPDL